MSEKQIYLCKVMSKDGKVTEKTIEADSKASVEMRIRSSGDVPVSITESTEKSGFLNSNVSLFERKIKSKELAVFCRQLFTMQHAGMPLIKSLGVLSEQTEHKLLKTLCLDMMAQVQKGRMFSEAMKTHSKYFPRILIDMIASGELTGRQDEVLEKMSIHFTKEDKIEKKIKAAMIYPKFLSALTVIMIVVMLTTILPTFSSMFENAGIKLPELTLFVMGMSDIVVNYWFLILLFVIVAIIMFKIIVANPDGKRMFDKFLLKVPIVKTSIGQIATSRFTRTLSTLLSSGLPIIQGLEMAAKVTNNTVVIDGVDEVTEDIKKGHKLSALISKITLFPPMLISMIAIGEESGSLEDMLARTSDYYDEELESAMTQLVGLVEPLMIAVMGLAIGFIVIAMMLPMFDLIGAVKQS